MAEAEELPKKVVMAWRQFMGTPEAIEGIMFLRRFHAPAGTGDTDAALVKEAHGWKGYQVALSDVEGTLTKLPVTEKPIEDPPLERDRE